jgi:catechol 2,3-dioxygenase-like lactoylglutathione lyase family enzyme
MLTDTNTYSGIAVTDLQEARRFYRDTLVCRVMNSLDKS